jgi:hypothetical protein
LSLLHHAMLRVKPRAWLEVKQRFLLAKKYVHLEQRKCAEEIFANGKLFDKLRVPYLLELEGECWINLVYKNESRLFMLMVTLSVLVWIGLCWEQWAWR